MPQLGAPPEGTFGYHLHAALCICAGYRLFPLEQGGPFPRDTHQVTSKQESLHCLSFLLNWWPSCCHRNCSTSTLTLLCLQHTMQSSTCPSFPVSYYFLVLLDLLQPYVKVDNLYACYTQLQKRSHCLSGNLLYYLQTMSFFALSQVMLTFQIKKIEVCIAPGSWLFARALQTLTPITYLWFPTHWGKCISISYALMLLLLQVSKWQVNSVNNPSVIKEVPGLTDRQFWYRLLWYCTNRRI